MKDLINRERAIATAISGLVRTYDGDVWIRVKEVRKSLKEMPPSQPEPKKGKWIKGQDVPNRKLYYHLKDALFCSVCYKEAYWDIDYGQQLFAYCPNCGAKMEVER